MYKKYLYSQQKIKLKKIYLKNGKTKKIYKLPFYIFLIKILISPVTVLFKRNR